MALEVCAAADEADREDGSSSQSSAPRRPGSNDRSIKGVSCGVSTTTAAPLGFRARLEGQIAGANSAAIRKTPPLSTAAASTREFMNAKLVRATQPQALQLNRRMSIDEMKEWYKSTVRPDKEERGRPIPIPGFTRLRRLGKDNSNLSSNEILSNTRFTKLVRVFQENRDFWLLYERGGRTLHELLFGIHGEFHKGSRVYRLEHRALYQQMRTDPAIVQSFLKQLLEAVKILSEHEIVHADIKPDNILLQWRGSPLPTSNRTPDVKGQHQRQEASSRATGLCVQLTDFGSTFTTEKNRYPATQSSKHGGGGGGTPEYVPPEALVSSAPPLPLRPQSSSLLKSTSSAAASSSERLPIQSTSSHSSSFDMWSVGAVFLELLCGFPLWFGYRSRIELQGKEYWIKNGGLFTTKRRDPTSIQQRQLHVVGDMERSLQSFPAGLLHDWSRQTADLALDLLRQLLDPCPKTRVAPEVALLHPFLA